MHSDLAYPPGELLAEELEARGMTQKDLARLMNRPAQAINEIIKAKKAITPETALGLEAALGIEASLWTNLEADYRLTLARNRQREMAIAETRPEETLHQFGLTPSLQIAEESASYETDTDD